MQPAWRNGVAAAIVAAGVFALLWSALRGREAPVKAAREAPQVRSTTSQAPAAPRAADVLRGALVASTDGKGIEVCGYGNVAVSDPADLPQDLEAALSYASPGLKRRIAALGASSEPSDRAVALRHEAVAIQWTTMEAALHGSRDCQENEACWVTAAQLGAQAAAPYVVSLAQMARQSTDPVAYALAYGACQSPLAQGAADCAAITAQRWAELEPDNGFAWLEVAAAAAQRRDESARAAAIERAADARRFDSHAGALLRPAAAATTATETPLDRLAVNSAALGAYTSAPIGSYHQAVMFCRESETAERRALCDRLATRLVDSDSTLLGRAMGRSIGARVGWSADRIAALDAEHQAMMWVEQRRAPERDSLVSCGGLAQLERRNRDLLQTGEVGAMRREMARTGHTTAELVAEYEAFQRQERERSAPPK